MRRVVVEQHHLARARAVREAKGVADGAMPEAEVGWVLRVEVLAVVDQQVGVPSELVAGDPVGLALVERLCERRLVVGDVAETLPGVGYPVAQRRAAMVDERGLDARGAELKGGRCGLEPDVRRQLANLD